jgi:toxin ParE1/3/4
LRKAVQRLRQFPEAGSMVTEFGNPNVREIYQGAYRIIYRVKSDKIDIVAVYHSARLLGELDF